MALTVAAVPDPKISLTSPDWWAAMSSVTENLRIETSMP